MKDLLPTSFYLVLILKVISLSIASQLPSPHHAKQKHRLISCQRRDLHPRPLLHSFFLSFLIPNHLLFLHLIHLHSHDTPSLPHPLPRLDRPRRLARALRPPLHLAPTHFLPALRLSWHRRIRHRRRSGARRACARRAAERHSGCDHVCAESRGCGCGEGGDLGIELFGR